MIQERLNALLIAVCRQIDRAESRFLNANNISTMTNQIVFFMLADRVFASESKVTCLYTLMFYNVIAYCIGYTKELIEKEDWSPYVTLTETSKIKHLAMSATKMVFEWTKAVTFIVTLTFMLLVFGLEQGLHRYRPSTVYTIVTWIYYMATEKLFVRMFPSALTLLRLEALENLEELYAPVILKSFTIAVSGLLVSILALLPFASGRLLVTAIYFNVYLRAKDLLRISAAALKLERDTLNGYKRATGRQIQRYDDVCAICLCDMTRARITPCYHLFHPHCLRQSLKTSNLCPVCKTQFFP